MPTTSLTYWDEAIPTTSLTYWDEAIPTSSIPTTCRRYSLYRRQVVAISNHWSLVIIYMPGKEDKSGPMILHLDSLDIHDRSEIVKNIKRSAGGPMTAGAGLNSWWTNAVPRSAGDLELHMIDDLFQEVKISIDEP
ncbi:hypothetical protein L1987_70328 [Smallanthus sonchifolius]|uniref:Uncharacterized protein n=1 Tax=Smallanthus sonchifolius TaxID=185202 RepID=A0ACB9ANR1_9ASTR|nr:hypothetical protein L1987_70328 [Smallanthus sonchifolius]